MKKIGAILFICLFIVGGYTGYRYYADTYKGEKAYAQVPLEIPERKQTLNNRKQPVSGLYSLKYTLTFVKSNGKTQVMEYERTDKNPQPLEPNAYIEATISKKRIIQSPIKIDKKEIPEKAFAQLNNRKTTSDN
ncbi:YxeA family protein [Enterococcus faecalis]|uniref:YxeA family protein n=1 Tax=Enterococcus faecalis TaxID=1351 RepID=UPI0034CFBAB3